MELAYTWRVLTYESRTSACVMFLAYFMDINGGTFSSLMFVSCLTLLCATVVKKTTAFTLETTGLLLEVFCTCRPN